MDCQTCHNYSDSIERLKAAIEKWRGERDTRALEEELREVMRKATKHSLSHRVN